MVSVSGLFWRYAIREIADYIPEKMVRNLALALSAIGILGVILASSFQEELGYFVIVIVALSGISFLFGLFFIIEYVDRLYFRS